MTQKLVPIKRALISVSDKTHLEQLIPLLQKFEVEVISTGGTAKFLQEKGLNITPIQEVTGNPEAFQGRMKTISFEIESALLYKRHSKNDLEDAKKLNIQPIDLVVCNLYPFEKHLTKKADEDVLIENIDIGGPTMIRAAAKNFQDVTVCTDPTDYQNLITELSTHAGSTSLELRRKLMEKAFALTAHYDSLVAKSLSSNFKTALNDNDLQIKMSQTLASTQDSTPSSLRYGENPHQQGVILQYNQADEGVAQIQSLHGKPLSYNNYLDVDAALRVTSDLYHASREWSQLKTPEAVTVIKHLNPCGLALSDDSLKSLQYAWKGDPVSAFGSILSFSGTFTKECANWLKDKFVEVIIARSYNKDALETLKKKKNLRILVHPPLSEKYIKNEILMKSVSGGVLLQEEDSQIDPELLSVTKLSFPQEKEMTARLGIMASKHLKSNAISLSSYNTQDNVYWLAGAGMGQPNRLDSLGRLAIPRAKENDPEALNHMVLVSDAFFPFADNIVTCSEYGLKYIVQPGGSIRDQEVIDSCNEHQISMAFTKIRHFRH